MARQTMHRAADAVIQMGSCGRDGGTGKEEESQ